MAYTAALCELSLKMTTRLLIVPDRQ